MEDILTNILIATAMFVPPVLLGIWFFGLRRYISKKGKTRITAISWGFSMWADWTVAWEIGREEKKVPLSAKLFLLIHIFLMFEFIAVLTI